MIVTAESTTFTSCIQVLKFMRKWTEDEIVNAFRKGGSVRREALAFLYREYFSRVDRLVQQEGGTTADAEDVFQEGLMIFYEKIVGPDFPNLSNPLGYLYGICRTLWRNHKTKQFRESPTGFVEAEEALNQATVREFEALEQDGPDLLKGIRQLGELCQQILIKYFYERQPLIRLAESLGLKDAYNAGARKSRCEKQLRAIYRK